MTRKASKTTGPPGGHKGARTREGFLLYGRPVWAATRRVDSLSAVGVAIDFERWSGKFPNIREQDPSDVHLRDYQAALRDMLQGSTDFDSVIVIDSLPHGRLK